jgi:hypothetical protein
MKYLAHVLCLCLCLSTSTRVWSAGSDLHLEYRAVPDWLKLPEGRTEIGAMHGDVAVSADGDVYISVQGSVRQWFAILGPNPGLQVYGADGRYKRNVPNAPPDLHGFIIRREATGEYIYAVRLAATSEPDDQTRANLDRQVVLTMTLDGKVGLEIPASAIPDRFKNQDDKRRPYMRLTGIAVAPNGDIYATDGYASDYIHHFSATGKYLTSFGGRDEPFGFMTLHKIAIDTRFNPVRIIACDRGHDRLVHLSLDGQFLGTVRANMKAPAAIAIHGDYAAIAELRPDPQVSVLDKSANVVSQFGANTVSDTAGNGADPSKWRSGVLTAPHGIAFNQHGDLFVSELNQYGRVHRFNLQPAR